MPTDSGFEVVQAWIVDQKRIARIGSAIRSAFDWVIDGGRTGRYMIEQLQTSEKIYIGNRAEHEILHSLDLEKQAPLDTIIENVPVDIKFSLTTSWMIPPEAVNQLCILATADDNQSTFSVGLIRAHEAFLGKPNRDGKCGILRMGRNQIVWLEREGPLPSNFLLHLSAEVRRQILSKKSGQARVTELFRIVTDIQIPTRTVDTIAVQRDPSKRIRDARLVLNAEGIEVLGERYGKRRLEELGVTLAKDHWISLRTS